MTNRARLRELHTAEVITDRQLEILQLRDRGLSQHTIALGLGISRSTVRSTERDALAKIARHERTAAA